VLDGPLKLATPVVDAVFCYQILYLSGIVESLLANLVQLPTTIVADVPVFMEGNVS
jgi:hypothetical protein